jgi:hypothetical protein
MTRARKYRRICPECGEAFVGGPDSRFCTPAHRYAWRNRAGKRGMVAMPLVQAWRGGKSRKGDEVARYAFGELCALADLFNEEDRAAGRLPAGDYLRPKMEAGWRAIDLLPKIPTPKSKPKAA